MILMTRFRPIFARIEYLVGLSQPPQALTTESERILLRQKRIIDILIPIAYFFIFVLVGPAIVDVIEMISYTLPFIGQLGIMSPFHHLAFGTFFPAFAVVVSSLAGLSIYRATIRTKLAGHLIAPETTPKNYGLFLRSFFIDETMTATSDITPLPDARNFERLEVRLERSAFPGYRLIKIGSRSAFDFAGGTHRPDIADSEQWFCDMTRLANHAEHIFMVPIIVNTTSGTARELAHLSANDRLLRRTFFVCPVQRRIGSRLLPDFHRPTTRILWEASRRICITQFNIDLPAHQHQGALLLSDGKKWIPIIGLLGRHWSHPKSLQYLLWGKRPPQSAWSDAHRFTLVTFYLVLILPLVCGFFTSIFFSTPAADGRDLDHNAFLVAYGAATAFFATLPLWRRTAYFAYGLRSRMKLHFSVFVALILSHYLLECTWWLFHNFLKLNIGTTTGVIYFFGLVVIVITPLIAISCTSLIAMLFSQRNSQLVSELKRNSVAE